MAKKQQKGDKADRSSFLWGWIQNYPTRLAVYFPVFAALAIVAIGTWIGSRIYHGNPSAKYEDIVFLLACIVASLTGWIQISLREAYGFIWPVRGKAAIIWGALWVAVCWGVALLALWDYFAGPAR